jgi:ABC-type polysaccharide/polyol phosphate transport system ATPase subunit/ABC-type polysaccharide/polyol phosphate export permease
LPAEVGAVEVPVPAAISVENVKKTFIIPDERYTSFKSRAVALFRPERHQTLAALDELSFEVQRGEFFGVVGPNGSGKSTLLKCIAGIYGTDAGCVAVTGHVSPFLEMGVGFKEDFTARENVVLNGTLLGLSPAQIRERMDSIIAFADLEQFADMHLKNFSSGMRVRLAFSLAIQVDADILLLDEVFAVGDEAFNEKCFEQFRQLKQEGRTVVVVTHGMSLIRRFCDRALLLDSGRMAMLGDPAAVANGYSELNARLAVEREQAQARRDRGQIRHLPRRGIAFAGSGRRTTYNPSAFGDDLRGLARVTATLAKSEFQLHYRRSVLGYLWSVMQPLMLFGVLYLVFSGIVGLGGTKHYPVYVLTAIVLWTYFSEATGGGVISLVRSAGLVRKMRVPLVAIPLSVSLKAVFNLGMNGLVVVGFALASGVRPRVSWLELPLLVALLVVLTTGVVLILSTLYVRYRDTQQIWRVLERALFFCSPILYLATQYPDEVREVVGMTPIVMILTEMRHAFLDPSAPSAAALVGGAPWLLVPIALSVGVLALGMVLFNRQAPRDAELL